MIEGCAEARGGRFAVRERCLEPVLLGVLAVVTAAAVAYSVRLSGKLARATQTIRKTAEEQKHFEEYLEIAGAMILVLEPTGQIRSLNRKSQEVLGTQLEHVQGQDWFATFVPEDERGPIRARFLSLMSGAEGEEGYAEYAVVTPAGTRRHTVWYRRVLRDETDAVTGLLSVGFDDTDRKGLEAELTTWALHDELTGLYNRRGFGEVAEQVLELAKRTSREARVFFADVDNLKDINDAHGHAAGDAALIAAAQCLQEVFRSADVLARVGGDEFAALALGRPGDADGELLVRLRSRVEHACADHGLPTAFTLSLGMADVDLDRPGALEVSLALADRSMYVNKRGDAPEAAPKA